MDLKELKEKIENIKITYDYDEVYSELYNAVIDYQNETQDFDMDYLFEDFIDYDLAEERAKYELDTGGLIRLYYFLGDANLNNSLFRIDGYGNLSDVGLDDLECLKADILDNINDKMEN